MVYPPEGPAPTFDITDKHEAVVVLHRKTRCVSTREKLIGPCLVPRNIVSFLAISANTVKLYPSQRVNHPKVRLLALHSQGLLLLLCPFCSSPPEPSLGTTSSTVSLSSKMWLTVDPLCEEYHFTMFVEMGRKEAPCGARRTR